MSLTFEELPWDVLYLRAIDRRRLKSLWASPSRAHLRAITRLEVGITVWPGLQGWTWAGGAMPQEAQVPPEQGHEGEIWCLLQALEGLGGAQLLKVNQKQGANLGLTSNIG